MRILSGSPVSPTQLGSVNGGSSCRLEIRCLDDDDALFVPATLRYRIDNLSVVQQVLDWTAVASPATIQTLLIPAALNALLREWDDFETQQVTVEMTSEDGQTQQDVFVYQLVNIAQGRLPP